MSDVDEIGRTELDDQSMDEVYDMADELEDSVDTLASPTKQRVNGDDEDLACLRRKDAPPLFTMDEDRNLSDSDDEPPEIPGSPMKPMMPSGSKETQPDILVVDNDHKNDKWSDSSSSSSEDEYENDKQSRKERLKLKSEAKTPPKAALISSPAIADKPKPTINEFKQIPKPAPAQESKHTEQPNISSSFNPETSLPAAETKTSESDDEEDEVEIESNQSPNQSPNQLPPDIRQMLQYIEEFKPDTIEIPVYIQPFIPEYIPSIGSPYEGAHVLRPDNVDDPIGLKVLAEPGGIQSNVAELQLMLKSDYKPIHAKWEMPVLSIEDAEAHPETINAWIESVAKVQQSQPLCQVHYSKPMPSIESLMDIWPDHIEALLSQMTLPPAHLDVSLTEYTRILCGIVNIPVYDNHLRESLHVAFTLYQAFNENPHFARYDNK